jgi:hypothetical protein
MRKLNLNKLKAGLPVISKNRGANMAEAIAFCLTMQGFKSGVQLNIEGDYKDIFEIVWTDIIDIIKSWQYWKEATEEAAMGLSVLVLMELTAYNYFERSHQATGYDFWLDSIESENWREIENKKLAKLEISGIWKETKSNSVNMRINQKLKQVKRVFIEKKLPIIITVIEFGTPKGKIIKR